MTVPTKKEIRVELEKLLAVVRANSGVSQRLGEFIWAAHCGSGLFDFGLFSSLDRGNLTRVKMILNYRLNPAAGGYDLPLSDREKGFLHKLALESAKLP
ncbi:hypothetical protein [Phaeobacter piscinae]|uniref:hypothetical protein n=1 Tax=Phaeobacter piscinae TaxID=1580596 RepID=UPI000BBE6053|nr:hypothetical protein [Phaeobacter piscinae]ATG41973.1 hypothetical protein PhaeoP14_03941 [Phaeobacter piscinae]